MVADAFNPSTCEAKAGSPGSRPAWSTERVQNSQGHTEKLSLGNNNRERDKRAQALPLSYMYKTLENANKSIVTKMNYSTQG